MFSEAASVYCTRVRAPLYSADGVGYLHTLVDNLDFKVLFFRSLLRQAG